MSDLKLENLEKEKWQLADAMDKANSLAESTAIMVKFQQVIYEIYLLEQKRLGINKTTANKIMSGLLQKHQIEFLGEQK